MTPDASLPPLCIAATMALDADDARSRTNDPGAPAPADPAVEALFPGWSVERTDRLADPGFGPERLLVAFAVAAETVARAEDLDRLVELSPGIWDFA